MGPLVSIALGWMIGTGLFILLFGQVTVFTGVSLIILGILGFVGLITGGR